MDKSFISIIETSIKQNWDLDALTDYKGATLQYKDLARKIEKLHILLAESGVKPGDKVALCGRNSSHWGVAFLAIITYGAVAVPILHEFKADNVHNIVNHSDARLLFVGDVVWEALNEAEMPNLEGIILMTDFTLLVCRSEKLEYAREHLNEMFGKKFPRNFRREHVSYRRDLAEELAIINYTSGTTSFSKGVMIPYRALWSNTRFAFEVMNLKPGNRVISILPMAHMYGLAFEFLYEVCAGCHVYFLTRMPSPKIIFQAFSDVKPHIVIAVPLIIEKIIKKNILPKLETLKMKILLKVPLINDKIKATVREHMIQAFGGNFYELIIGGAAFNQDIEKLLRSIDFPYTVGYGMTECSPVISTTRPWNINKNAVGQLIDNCEAKTVDGELWVRGSSVMQGYYKMPEETAATLEDGWLKTGDLGYVDEEGFVYLTGRKKNLIITKNGENVSPEELENKLSPNRLVQEVLVRENKSVIEAEIFPDYEYAKKKHIKDVRAALQEIIDQYNLQAPPHKKIYSLIVRETEFEKTPSKKIKRF